MTTDWARLDDMATAAEREGVVGRIAIAVRVQGGNGAPIHWNRRGDDVFLSASTIKVAILIAVARAIDAGSLRHDDRRSAGPQDTISGSGVLKGMEPGLSLTVDDHAYLMIAVSDNTASNVLIEAVGLEAVRAVTADLGLTQTHLRRPFLGALPTDDLPRNQITATEFLTMLAAIADSTAASPAACQWMGDLLRAQQHVDRLGRDLPHGVGFSGKSGSLDGIVHDGAILDGPTGQVIITVLTSDARNDFETDALLGRLARTAVLITGIANGNAA